METVKSSRYLEQPSVDKIDYQVPQQEELELLIEKLCRQRLDEDLSDDQGICLSGSSSPTELSGEDLGPGDDDLFEPAELSSELLDVIEELVNKYIMALDLRKNTNSNKLQEQQDDAKSEFSDDDNTAVALDLTASSARKSVLGPPPPLTPLLPPGPADAIKRLTPEEKNTLRQSYHRLVQFLRLDSPNRDRFTEDYRTMAQKRLQSFLFMYLIEVKKKKTHTGINMLQESFGSDMAIRQFFRVFLGKSEQLIRSSSLPGAVVHPMAARAAMEDGPPQILCRGPGHERSNRNTAFSNAPYPLRRVDSSHHPYAGGSISHGHRTAHIAYQSTHPYGFHQQQGYPLPSPQSWYPNSSSYQPLPPQSQSGHSESSYRHPQPPFDNLAHDPLPISLEDVIHRLCQIFPLNDEVKGLSSKDFEDLYGQYPVGQPPSPKDDNAMAPSPSGSYQTLSPCASYMAPSPSNSYQTVRTPQNGSSIPGSPVSPWQTTTYVGGSLGTSPHHPSSSSNSPYSNVMSPPSLPSANSSPAPGSPLPRSVENQMIRMSLVHSQPPPLIPLVKTALPARQQPAIIAPKQPSIQATPPSQPINKYRTAHEEMGTRLNPAIKEQSIRQVVKSTLEALTVADHDGDTPLMVACANPAYKNEDLYALLERLKSHPQPAKVFSAVNHRRESALFLAASERRPLVAGYLAETMSALRIPLNQTYEKGNTLIHYLAMWGDEFNEVLRYLVRVRTPDDKLAFDLNARNHTGRSALHETVMLYQLNDPVGEGFIKNIQLLLEYGADAGLSDITSGKTPVHIAIEKRDPFLLELLLSKCPGSANAPMYNDNRPLHSAATLTEVTDMQQLELVNILLKYGADKALRNKANKLPIELVQQDRDRVKAVLQARSRQNYVV